MNNCKSQIDYSLVNRKWKNSLKNCEAYSTFVKVGSNHPVLSATLRLSLRTKTKSPRTEKYGWSVLKSNRDLQHRYLILRHNRLSILKIILQIP